MFVNSALMVIAIVTKETWGFESSKLAQKLRSATGINSTKS